MRKKSYTLYACILGAIMLTACEMRDELTGKNLKTSYGKVLLNISNNSSITSKANADFSGTAPGVFPEEEINIDNYTLKIINSNGAEVEGGGKIADLKQDGEITFPLLEGNYTLKAYNYDGSNTSASERPYFLGTNNITVQSGVDTEAEVVCKLNNIEVIVVVDASFTTAFKDTYEVTVDNGDGAILFLNKDNINKKYYLQVPENKNFLNASIKATTTDGTPIAKSFKINKPTDAEGNSLLAPGDSFTIRITDEGSTSAYIKLGISVDFSFKEQDEIVTIPVEDIVFNPQPTEPEPEPSEPITFVGLPAEYTDPADSGTPVVVTINAAKGIENLFVTINSDNEDFMGTLSGFGLDQKFDIANPGELEGILTGSLESGDGIGLLKPGEKIKGETSYIFDVTEFMGLLKLFGSSVNTFTMEVQDSEGNSASGVLTVTITQ